MEPIDLFIPLGVIVVVLAIAWLVSVQGKPVPAFDPPPPEVAVWFNRRPLTLPRSWYAGRELLALFEIHDGADPKTHDIWLHRQDSTDDEPVKPDTVYQLRDDDWLYSCPREAVADR